MITIDAGKKPLSNAESPRSDGGAEVVGTADPASSGKLLWIHL